MKKALLGLVLAITVSTVSAQALWGGAPIGASPAEVSRLLPEVKDTSAEQRAQEQGLLLEIPRHELAGQDFLVSFFFEDNQLQRVVLLANPGSTERARAVTQELGASLRARYGLDVGTRSRRSEVREGSVDRMWLFRRMSIRLQLLNDMSVRLTYSAESPTPTPSRGL
ncbi:hypothetical protein [Hydrogenophaga sp.]|uniref:hypothetical protein n=1 Tax=Hydrogenophaga sp. TaxID=1904254 RepID=UPI00271FA2EA|nr:hypothetical protein [Hydrogenophaga sp.]MDO8905599.1 hypothetical protein [Hydrogenophaga sp.]